MTAQTGTPHLPLSNTAHRPDARPESPGSTTPGLHNAAGHLALEHSGPVGATTVAVTAAPPKLALHHKESAPCPTRCVATRCAHRGVTRTPEPMPDPTNDAEPYDEPGHDTDRPQRQAAPAQDHAADAWLVGKARGGDPAAYEALVRRHRVRVYRIALRMLGNHEDAEDVAQDTFVQVWSALAGFVGGAQFTTWLYRIVINRCLNHKRRPPPPVPLRDEDHPAGTGPEDTVVAEHRARATAAAIAALPADQRTVLVLHQMEGLTYQEVADILKLPEPTVRGRLARARRTLLADLRDWA